MNRRELLFSIAVPALASVLGLPAQTLSAGRRKNGRLGIDDYSYNLRLTAERSGRIKGQLGDPLNFLEHCHRVGAGGIQIDIGVRDQAYIGKLREKAEAYGMFVEGSARLPADQAQLERFEAAVRTAAQAGAKVIRVAMGGRRYEQFDRAEQFKTFKERSWKSVQLAEPVAAKHRTYIAIENHKDWRISEMLDMLKRIGSQYIGVCVDTGNSFALLEDPMAVVEAYAPYAFAVHLKDMAVAEYEDGFLLADVPLGQGLLDLPRMVEVLREARPEIDFCLEMATRDPLRVSCLTEKYWATLEDVSGADLARTLRYVRANKSRSALPEVSRLPLQKQIELEESNIKDCLAFARQQLNL